MEPLTTHLLPLCVEGEGEKGEKGEGCEDGAGDGGTQAVVGYTLRELSQVHCARGAVRCARCADAHKDRPPRLLRVTTEQDVPCAAPVIGVLVGGGGERRDGGDGGGVGGTLRRVHVYYSVQRSFESADAARAFAREHRDELQPFFPTAPEDGGISF